MRILSKFLVLLWKNLLLKRRHWLMTVLEICVPVLLFIVLAVIRGEIVVEDETSIKLERDITYQVPLPSCHIIEKIIYRLQIW